MAGGKFCGGNLLLARQVHLAGCNRPVPCQAQVEELENQVGMFILPFEVIWSHAGEMESAAGQVCERKGVRVQG